MHIVHCLIGRPKQESSNGVVKAVYFLSKNQAALGHTVSALSIRSKPVAAPLQLFHNVTNYLFAMRKSRFAVDPGIIDFFKEHRNSISIVHFHGGYQPEYWRISTVLSRIGIPFVITPHGSYQSFANRKSFFKKRLYKRLFEKSIIRNAIGVNALNQREKSEVSAYGVKPEKIFVVPNGIDFSSIPRKDEVANMDCGISRISGVKIVYCGRIDVFSKGLDILLEGFAMAMKKAPRDMNLIIVGKDQGGGPRELKAASEKLGLGGNVHLIGPRFGKEKYCVYASADLFALTSRTEGMPTSVLEAMAFGLPCLLTPQTNVDKEAGEAGACAFTDLAPVSIADALQRLLQDKGRLAAMGHKAKEYVRLHYDYADIARTMCDSYKELLSS